LTEIVAGSRDKGITFKEINKHWRKSRLNDEEDDLPKRTLLNHKIAIEEIFGLTIKCEKDGEYRYYIENTEDLRNECMLNTLAFNLAIKESQAVNHRILYEQIPSGEQFLTGIIEAMRNGLTLEIAYMSFEWDEPVSFEIEPYCVKVLKQRWYVLARSPYLDAIRIYSLDRIQKLTITEKPFVYPENFQPEAYFDHAFGIWVNEKIPPCLVLLRAFGDQRKYLRTLPLHPSQEEKEKTEESSIFSYYLSPTRDFMRELMSHLDEIEVISPEWFREETKQAVEKMLQLYQVHRMLSLPEINNRKNKKSDLL
jgi:hypothetical protein